MIICHVYIKSRSPQLNGKVERSQRSDQEEFYQLLNYVDDQDLNKKLEVWEKFYSFSRPHGAFGGQAPYEDQDFGDSDLRETFQLIRFMVMQPSVGSTADVVRSAFSA